MPDICMCTGGDCPKKGSCYRHRARPDKFAQTYFEEPPYNSEGCDYYWPIEEDKS